MEAKHIIVFIALVSFGLIFLGGLIESVGYYTSTTENAVINDTINFAVNNTCYYGIRGPMATITAVYSNTTSATAGEYAAGSSSLTGCNGGLKIYTNGTVAYPNVTTGSKYVSYTIYKNSGIGGALLAFITAALILVVVLKVFNYV